MAHKKCLKKMRENVKCDCINDDLKEIKFLQDEFIKADQELRKLKQEIEHWKKDWGTLTSTCAKIAQVQIEKNKKK